MDIRYNVSELFQAAFGINSPIFITSPLNKDPKSPLSFSGMSVLPDNYPAEATSWMGTPIIGQLKFGRGSYKKYDPFGALEEIELPDFILPAATLFTFRRSKNITKTNLLGSNGTVKEIFGFDDWIIEAKGLAVDTPEKTAREQIDGLKIWEEIAGSIPVYGDLFSVKNILAVAIEDYKEESVQGAPGIIPFSLTMSSDEPIEMILQSQEGII